MKFYSNLICFLLVSPLLFVAKFFISLIGMVEFVLLIPVSIVNRGYKFSQVLFGKEWILKDLKKRPSSRELRP